MKNYKELVRKVVLLQHALEKAKLIHTAQAMEAIVKEVKWEMTNLQERKKKWDKLNKSWYKLKKRWLSCHAKKSSL